MKVIPSAFGVSAFIRDEKSVDIIRVIANGILAAEIEGELADRGGELAPNNSQRTGRCQREKMAEI